MSSYNKIVLVLVISLLVSVVFFVLGLITPIVQTSTNFLGLSLNIKELSLFDTIYVFYETTDYFLAIIIFVFTIIIPLVSYIHLFYRFIKIIKRQYYKPNFNLDKWNMLDVFVVAILVLNFKTANSIMAIDVQLGTLYIAIAVVSRIIIVEIFDRCFTRRHFVENRWI